MDQQKGGKGFGSLFSKLAKAGKKVAKTASNKIDLDKISDKIDKASTTIDKASTTIDKASTTVNKASTTIDKASTKISEIDENAGMFANLAGALTNVVPQQQKTVTHKDMKCTCTCNVPVESDQSGGYNDIPLEVYADKLINIVSARFGIPIKKRKRKIDRISRGLLILSKHGFDVGRDRDFHDLLYSNKFNGKPGFRTISNAFFI